MTEKLKSELSALGADVCGGLNICMNLEPLYEKLLTMFINDTDFFLLKKAIQENDNDKAYDYAHSLKGSWSNIGFNHLLELLPQKAEYNTEQAKIQISLLTKRYNDTCLIIKENLEL